MFIPRFLASRLKVSKAKKMKFPQYRYFPTVHVKKRKKLKESPENIAARQTCPRRDRQDKEEIEAETQREGQLL